MKLLVDQNISRRVVPALGADFPGSAHVLQIGYERAPDAMVWDYAKANGFSILSRDSDFLQFSYRFGPPPKLFWLRAGNQSVDEMVALISSRVLEIKHFEADAERGVLVLT